MSFLTRVIGASLIASVALVAQSNRVAAGLQTGPSEVSGDWPMYSHSLSGQRYSPLTEITTTNVARLASAWSLRLTEPAAGRRGGGPPAAAGRQGGAAPAGGAAGGRGAGAPAANLEEGAAGSNPQVTPIVIGGVMYLPARGNQVLALDAETGKEVWRALLPRYVTTTARGVAYWPGGRAPCGQAEPRSAEAARRARTRGQDAGSPQPLARRLVGRRAAQCSSSSRTASAPGPLGDSGWRLASLSSLP